MQSADSINEATLMLLYERRHWSWDADSLTATHAHGLSARFYSVRSTQSGTQMGYQIALVYHPSDKLVLDIGVTIIPSMVNRLGRWFLQGDPTLTYVIAEQFESLKWRATSGIHLAQAQSNLDDWPNP